MNEKPPKGTWVVKVRRVVDVELTCFNCTKEQALSETERHVGCTREVSVVSEKKLGAKRKSAPHKPKRYVI